jgi:tight adherence protein C
MGNVTVPLVASAIVGAAVAAAVWWIVAALRSEDLRQTDQWRYDVSRINELRRIDPIFRIFYPLVRLLAGINRVALADVLPTVQRELQAAGLSRCWLAEEYLARAELISLLAAPVYIYAAATMFGSEGLVAAAFAVPLTAWLLRRQLAGRAARRLHEIKRRMPFLLDLLTLLMEAGSNFLTALEQAVDEFQGHPVAEEFGRVLTDIHMGKTRAEAFAAMRQRLRDDEITSIIGSILQGEALGTPLATIFRTQSDVLRIKRTQRAETLAGEAGVNMLLPGVLVMAATVLIIVGPFLLNYLDFGLQM